MYLGKPALSCHAVVLKIYSNVVPMIAGVRRGLCAASMFLLCMAAPVLLSVSSAVAEPAPKLTAIHTQPQQTAIRRHTASGACPHLTAPAFCKAVLFHLASRAFAEDAPPPPSETLETAELHLPLATCAIGRTASSPLHSHLFCVCNRQRAP
jgi:hypothetical protein